MAGKAAARRGTASIRDIARDVGRSISTVSRVINDRDGVDPATRKRVREAIDRLTTCPT